MSRRHHNYYHSAPVHHAQTRHPAAHLDTPSHSDTPHQTIEYCPFAHLQNTNPSVFDAGALLTDPEWAGLAGLPRRDTSALGLDGIKSGAEKYGCLELQLDGKAANKRALPTIPSVNDMLENARGLRRIATGDTSQPDFSPYDRPKESSAPIASAAATPVESNETAFKRHYVTEALALGEKRGITKEDMKKILLGIYSIEGFGRIPHDMQSGTSFKYADADQPGTTTNEDARRAGTTRISSALGYNQITFPANLHLLHDDHGAIPERLRQLSKVEEGKPDGGRSEELKQKALLTEELQGKLHDALLNFAQQSPNGKNLYLNRDGELNAKAYMDFSRSNDATPLGMTGKELTTGLHALLLDPDIGPILQARQLDEDIEQTLRPEFQKYLEAKTVSSKAAAKAIENLLADAAGKALTKKQQAELLNQWEKLQIVPDTADGAPEPPKNILAQGLDSLAKLFQKPIPTVDYGSLAPAGAMACNLAGPDACRAMFEHSQSSTRNFMSGEGYRLNPVLHGANVDQFLHRLTYQMSQKRGAGTTEFERLFDEQMKPQTQPARPSGPVQPGEQQARPNEQPVRPNEQPARPNEQPVRPTEQPVRPNEPLNNQAEQSASVGHAEPSAPSVDEKMTRDNQQK